MVDEIIITQSTGVDEWGEPLPEVDVNIKGYVEWKTRLVWDINGEEVVSTVAIYIKKRTLDNVLARTLSHEDRVKSINGDEIDRAIINIHQPKAFSNPHYEIQLA